IVTGGGDGMARVWEVRTDKAPLTLKGHTGSVTSVAISSDGKRIVTGSKNGTAKVWDAQTGKEVLLLKGHTAGVAALAFAPDSKWIVTGSGKYGYLGEAKVWD